MFIVLGSHLPWLYIGMEYLRTNNLNLAQQFFERTRLVCSTDPLVCNELGVVAYRRQKYDLAVEFFLKVMCGDYIGRM